MNTATWKQQLERRLLEGDTPEVLTTAMLRAMTIAGRSEPPSPATFARWLQDWVAKGMLREVIKGVYLNRIGHRDVTPAAAAAHIRRGSIVSMSWVLEQAGITNNFGDTVTCIIPTDPAWPNPQIGDRTTAAGTFRFFGMPAKVVDAGKFEDNRDARFDYPRATPERALVDWIYLGASARSRLSPPPRDLDLAGLKDRARLKRLVKATGVQREFDEWKSKYETYQRDEDVRENAATGMRW
ncbi:MAG: hypothetical protein V4787_23795 [Pseudomonadota bacterium]